MNNTIPSITLTAALVLLGLIAAALGFLTTAYMGAATYAYLLMVSGLLLRTRNRHWHRGLMIAAMSMDLGLVLLLELQRDAIGTVIALDLSPLQMAHVACSTLALALYLPVLYLGQKLWTLPSAHTRRWHLRFGLLAFAFRTLGFLLMFSLLWRESAH